jgi:hypothetical protein
MYRDTFQKRFSSVDLSVGDIYKIFFIDAGQSVFQFRVRRLEVDVEALEVVALIVFAGDFVDMVNDIAKDIFKDLFNESSVARNVSMADVEGVGHFEVE